jgi:hypothetical protein
VLQTLASVAPTGQVAGGCLVQVVSTNGTGATAAPWPGLVQVASTSCRDDRRAVQRDAFAHLGACPDPTELPTADVLRPTCFVMSASNVDPTAPSAPRPNDRHVAEQSQEADVVSTKTMLECLRLADQLSAITLDEAVPSRRIRRRARPRSWATESATKCPLGPPACLIRRHSPTLVRRRPGTAKHPSMTVCTSAPDSCQSGIHTGLTNRCKLTAGESHPDQANLGSIRV